jgi:hypothetical protein
VDLKFEVIIKPTIFYSQLLHHKLKPKQNTKNTMSIFKMENAKSSPPSILFTLFQSYVEHDFKKNKIVVAFTTSIFGISTKFEALAPKLRH